jgi:hypothetical protein
MIDSSAITYADPRSRTSPVPVPILYLYLLVMLLSLLDSGSWKRSLDRTGLPATGRALLLIVVAAARAVGVSSQIAAARVTSWRSYR